MGSNLGFQTSWVLLWEHMNTWVGNNSLAKIHNEMTLGDSKIGKALLSLW